MSCNRPKRQAANVAITKISSIMKSEQDFLTDISLVQMPNTESETNNKSNDTQESQKEQAHEKLDTLTNPIQNKKTVRPRSRSAIKRLKGRPKKAATTLGNNQEAKNALHNNVSTDNEIFDTINDCNKKIITYKRKKPFIGDNDNSSTHEQNGQFLNGKNAQSAENLMNKKPYLNDINNEKLEINNNDSLEPQHNLKPQARLRALKDRIITKHYILSTINQTTVTTNIDDCSAVDQTAVDNRFIKYKPIFDVENLELLVPSVYQKLSEHKLNITLSCLEAFHSRLSGDGNTDKIGNIFGIEINSYQDIRHLLTKEVEELFGLKYPYESICMQDCEKN